MRLATCSWIAGTALALFGAAPRGGDETQTPKADDAVKELVTALGEHGIRLDPERGLCAIDVRVGIRDDLLEYVLVHPRGQSHESLFTTEVPARALNTALLALGVQAGENVKIQERVPAPTPEELRDGATAYTLEPPKGDGVYLYAGWREADEVYWFRVEDLVRDLATGRSMQRHRFVFLGSKTAPDRKNPGQELFAAEIEGNYVNLALFEQGFTLVTTALPECIQQSNWLPNAWLLPDRGSDVLLVFSRERLDRVPESWVERLPIVERSKR